MNNNSITYFSNKEFGKIRVAVIDNEPWFSGRDIAGVLGWKDTWNTAKDLLDNKDRKTIVLPEPTCTVNNRLQMISEKGVNTLVRNSRNTKAGRLVEWIAKDILPHYGYTTEPTVLSESQIEAKMKVIECAKRILKLSDATVMEMLKSTFENTEAEISVPQTKRRKQ